jgi:asparagine synthetase B (glutamine-hydrolysing)
MWNDGLPHFIVRYRKDIKSGSGLNLSIQHEGVYPPPYFHQDERYEICLLGSPIIEQKIAKEKVIDLVIKQDKNMNSDAIDGEFLLIWFDKNNSTVTIINDRFCSIPLFYFLDEKDGFVASINYTDLWLEFGLYNHINKPAFFELMWLHRLMGEKTLDTKTVFLPSASVLKYDGKNISLKSYWKPSFKKTEENLNSCAHELARLLKQSIRMKTSDNPKAGLFLSGGRDSRSVLAAFPVPPVCFTLAVSRNREYQVAKKLSSVKKAKHVYLRLPEDKYSIIYKKAIKLAGGMYLYDHAIFLDYADEVRTYADVAFHGYGLDFMFQGMYVPTRFIRIFGKQLFIPRLKQIEGDIVDYYINNIDYRLKGVNLLDYLKVELREEYMQQLKLSINRLFEKPDIEFYNPYDKWKYLITHALSRHYTYPNTSSISTYMEQRTVSFQNDIFDLFLKLPVKYRIDGRVSRRCLKILNPQMANITSANSGVRAAGSCYERAFLQFVDGLWTKTRKLVKSEIYPSENERTWFTRDPAIRNEPQLRQAVTRACHSEMLRNSLDFLNMDKIQTDVKQWLNMDYGGGPLMATLININEFLSLR